jgi:sporadic carbohydrate cluster 2OG-Fe(II) oxygenase|tara:strand:- start:274 stop:1071 length:798 start_codon:yes stop_codon:yes gene_type:complete
MNLLSKYEQQVANRFSKNGYIIEKIQNLKKFYEIEKLVINLLKKEIKNFKKYSNQFILNNAHKFIRKDMLNQIRLKIINYLNSKNEFIKNYYFLSKPYLDILVGNELSMQKRINLSVQFPKDNSSLLALHSDVWSGDSPFEIVVWLPLVNCHGTKSMYILPPKKYKKFEKIFENKNNNDSEKIYKKIKKDLKWIKINYGEILIFNQCLPHGNIVNQSNETRWTFNCRFKGLFTPYNDKKIAEFFQPITMKPVSQIGLDYKLPKLK